MIAGLPEDFTKTTDYPPVMQWQRFAEWIRVEPGIFVAWMDRGYIPVIKVGKHRLVNIVALVEQLKESEQ